MQSAAGQEGAVPAAVRRGANVAASESGVAGGMVDGGGAGAAVAGRRFRGRNKAPAWRRPAGGPVTVVRLRLVPDPAARHRLEGLFAAAWSLKRALRRDARIWPPMPRPACPKAAHSGRRRRCRRGRVCWPSPARCRSRMMPVPSAPRSRGNKGVWWEHDGPLTLVYAGGPEGRRGDLVVPVRLPQGAGQWPHLVHTLGDPDAFHKVDLVRRRDPACRAPTQTCPGARRAAPGPR